MVFWFLIFLIIAVVSLAVTVYETYEALKPVENPVSTGWEIASIDNCILDLTTMNVYVNGSGKPEEYFICKDKLCDCGLRYKVYPKANSPEIYLKQESCSIYFGYSDVKLGFFSEYRGLLDSNIDNSNRVLSNMMIDEDRIFRVSCKDKFNAAVQIEYLGPISGSLEHYEVPITFATAARDFQFFAFKSASERNKYKEKEIKSENKFSNDLFDTKDHQNNTIELKNCFNMMDNSYVEPDTGRLFERALVSRTQKEDCGDFKRTECFVECENQICSTQSVTLEKNKDEPHEIYVFLSNPKPSLPLIRIVGRNLTLNKHFKLKRLEENSGYLIGGLKRRLQFYDLCLPSSKVVSHPIREIDLILQIKNQLIMEDDSDYDENLGGYFYIE